MYAAISRIYSAALRRLDAFITALPGGYDGCGRSSRGSHRKGRRRRWPSPFRTPLGSPMSMSSIIGAGDDQATPASSAAAYATPQGEAATPPPAWSSPLLTPRLVVVALDATRSHRDDEIKTAINRLLLAGDILRSGDSLLVLGVVHSITHPMGYQSKPSTASFDGTSDRYLGDQVAKIAEFYKSKLYQFIEMLHIRRITLTLKVSLGAPAKLVIIHEVNSSNAEWVVLDRHFRRDFRHLDKHIACKIAAFQEDLHVQQLKIMRSNPSSKHTAEVKDLQRFAVTMGLSSKTLSGDTNIEATRPSPVSYLASLSNHETSSMVACSMPYFSGMSLILDDTVSLSNGNYEEKMTSQHDSSERPVLCIGCGLKSVLYIKESMKFPFSEIHAATSGFSNENLLGEGGFGHVYKGQLKDGQVIAAKLRKEASSQGYTEFFSEVQVLSFARHRNIVMLLGYCCKESYNILVYEYICNNSLEWHLFDKSADLLEWHKRHDIAVGIAKGLRFLHEECRAGPIIHRDLRPSNVLLTHDFVPMLGDFGLAKWKAGNGNIETRILGQSGYLAPEYAQFGMVSIRTDVYAFGIVLFQLISGRKVLDEYGGQSTPILQWAEPLVESLALHELIDDRIKDAYDTYELYQLARAAYLCVRTNPEQRPSMGEIVRLIETENDHIRDLSRQFIPHFMK